MHSSCDDNLFKIIFQELLFLIALNYCITSFSRLPGFEPLSREVENEELPMKVAVGVLLPHELYHAMYEVSAAGKARCENDSKPNDTDLRIVLETCLTYLRNSAVLGHSPRQP